MYDVVFEHDKVYILKSPPNERYLGKSLIINQYSWPMPVTFWYIQPTFIPSPLISAQIEGLLLVMIAYFCLVVIDDMY